MSREVAHVDLVLLAWARTAPDPHALLEHVRSTFSRSNGRLGYVLTGGALEGLRREEDETVEHIVLTAEGLLTGTMTLREDPPALNWDRGTLSVWRGADILPATATAAAVGRPLVSMVAHPLLPTGALVSGIRDDGAWLRIACTGFSVGFDGSWALDDGRRR